MKAHCCGCLGWKMQTTHKKLPMSKKWIAIAIHFNVKYVSARAKKKGQQNYLKKLSMTKKSIANSFLCGEYVCDIESFCKMVSHGFDGSVGWNWFGSAHPIFRHVI